MPTCKIQYTNTNTLYLRLNGLTNWEELYNMFSKKQQQRYFQQNKEDLTNAFIEYVYKNNYIPVIEKQNSEKGMEICTQRKKKS